VSFQIAAGLLMVGCSAGGAVGQRDDLGPPRMYSGFGNYHRAVSTASPEAQQWFDQGIQLLYGFNHDEAIRSFHRAADLDPNCAMAWWGIAYAHGLHINNPEMGREQSRAAWNAARQALKHIDGASPVEQSLIRAVVQRYAWPPPEDRRPLDEAYAQAMAEAWRQHRQDPDVGALYAESLMNLQPWALWTHDGKPKGRTEEIVGVLEAVMAMAPQHPGANHFYIHAVEASLTPERATAAAERLGALVPGSGHLVHMPSHIFIRTGRYADAAQSNERAIEVDTAYFSVAPPPRFYRIYYVHNIHFLAYASMMEGRYEAAMAAARRLESDVPEQFVREYVTIADGLMSTALHVMVRFGRWDDILKEPAPADFRLLSRATWHYARGVALAALDRTAEGRRELEAFDRAARQVAQDWYVGNNAAGTILPIMRRMLAGELAFREGRREECFRLLREAVTMEEELAYDEPPGWMQPVRHALGALLVADARHAEAEAVYRADLRRHPNNGWSLRGLQQALAAQGRTDDAQMVAQQLTAAWARADVTPHASCYCQPATP